MFKIIKLLYCLFLLINTMVAELVTKLKDYENKFKYTNPKVELLNNEMNCLSFSLICCNSNSLDLKSDKSDLIYILNLADKKYDFELSYGEKNKISCNIEINKKNDFFILNGELSIFLSDFSKSFNLKNTFFEDGEYVTILPISKIYDKIYFMRLGIFSYQKMQQKKYKILWENKNIYTFEKSCDVDFFYEKNSIDELNLNDKIMVDDVNFYKLFMRYDGSDWWKQGVGLTLNLEHADTKNFPKIIPK